MSFLIEEFLTKILYLFIYKRTGWDAKTYKELLNKKETFVFSQRRKFYAFLRYLALFLLLCCIIIFLFIYFYGLYNNNQYIQTVEHHHVIYTQKYNQDLLYDAWTFLLFGFLFYLDYSDQRSELFKNHQKTTILQRMNHRYSCQIPYWIVLWIMCSIRIVLLFSIEHAWVIMNPKYIHDNIMHHPDSYSLTMALGITYYLMIIFNGALIVAAWAIIFTHSHLKLKYLTCCIKNDSFLALLVMKINKEERIKKEKSLA